MKRINLIFCISLVIIAICTVILAGSNIIGIKLPDALIRALGIIDLICLPVLAFTTVKKIKK